MYATLLTLVCMQGEAGTGNVVEAVRHCRSVMGAIRQLQTMDEDEIYVYAKEIRAPVELVRQTKHLGRCVLHIQGALVQRLSCSCLPASLV